MKQEGRRGRKNRHILSFKRVPTLPETSQFASNWHMHMEESWHYMDSKIYAPFSWSLKQTTFILIIMDSSGCLSIVNKDCQGVVTGDVDHSALILKWLNAGADHWAHNSTLSGNNFPNWLFSRVSLHIRLCRSVSGCRLCKTRSRKASLEFCEREQRWPLTADEKISHEKDGGMDRSRCQTVINRETEVGGGGRPHD